MNYFTDKIDMSIYNDNYDIPLIYTPISSENIKKENNLLIKEKISYNTIIKLLISFSSDFIHKAALQDLGIEKHIIHSFDINNFKLPYGDTLYIANCSELMLPTDEFYSYEMLKSYDNVCFETNNNYEKKMKNNRIKWFKIQYQMNQIENGLNK